MLPQHAMNMLTRGAACPPGSSNQRPALWFVVPAHRRITLSAACFQALAATCARLGEFGIDATAVVIADDENLDAASAAGLATIEAPNAPLGAKWNAGYEHAGRAGADFLIPFGSDDIVDADVIASSLPVPGEVTCFRRSAVVSPDGRRMSLITVTYPGGDGIKIIPASLLAPIRFRPVDDARERALDGSMMEKLGRSLKFRYVYRDQHPLQIVDFKSNGQQMTAYGSFLRSSRGVDVDEVISDPFERLAEMYSADVLEPIRRVYSRARKNARATA